MITSSLISKNTQNINSQTQEKKNDKIICKEKERSQNINKGKVKNYNDNIKRKFEIENCIL